jgi:hypothetical protein
MVFFSQKIVVLLMYTKSIGGMTRSTEEMQHKKYYFIYLKHLVKVIIFPVPIILVSPYSNHEIRKI